MIKTRAYHWLLGSLFGVMVFLLVCMLGSNQSNQVHAQVPTISIPTVTGTPKGPMVSVRAGSTEPYVNVRAYPSTLAPAVGILSQGQEVPAIGISAGGDWILIEYQGAPDGIGWVFSSNVILSAQVPVVTPKATKAPEVTPTIDPTMAAQFNIDIQPTRLPTFTPPSPLIIPTYTTVGTTGGIGGIPIGLVIVLFFALGALVGVIFLLQNR